MARLSATLLVTALALSSATDADAKKRRVVVDRIVAIVDESPITKSALDRETRPQRKAIDRKHGLDADARATAVRELERTTLREMIDTRLLARAAERVRFSASKQEIDQAIAELARQNKRTVAEILQTIAAEGYDEADYRRRLGEQIIIWRLASYEAGKRTPDFGKLSADDQRAKVSSTMRALASELRGAAYIEERL